MKVTFFPLTFNRVTDSLKERMTAKAAWYNHHKPGYIEVLDRREIRPLPPPKAYEGQGTT